MNRKEFKIALDKIKNEYDAYYFENKYGENTHKKEFELLGNLPQTGLVPNAIAWIKDCYDCYYKNELNDDSPFAYLEKVIDEMETNNEPR